MAKYLLLRPREKASTSLQRFQQAGFSVEALALIETIPNNSEMAELVTYLRQNSTPSTVIVTSTVAASMLVDSTIADHHHFIAVGQSTGTVLKGAFSNVIWPDQQTSEGIIGYLKSTLSVPLSIVLVKGDGGRDLLPKFLQQNFANFVEFNIYQRNNISIDLQQLTWKTEDIECIIATSSQQMHRAFELFDHAWLTGQEWIVVSPRAKQQAIDLGIKSVTCSEGASDQQLIDTLTANRGDM